MEEVKRYYFALYAKACVYITPNNNPYDIYPIEWNEFTFYDKTFFCAHIRQSTYDKLSCDDIETLAFLDTEEQLQSNLITEPESIEDLCESMIVCFEPGNGKEIDASNLTNPKGFSCIFYYSKIFRLYKTSTKILYKKEGLK